MLRRSMLLAGLAGAFAFASAPDVMAQQAQPGNQGGSVIFFHPDGFGVNHWGFVRMMTVGPDGRLNWDRLPAIAVYTGHMKDALTGTSHGGATVHAYGVKVQADSFGQDGNQRIRSLSGFEGSIAHEAMRRGKAVGLVQSGAAYEPGTAAFVASTERRANLAEITRLVVESGVDVHLAGGERWYLPRGVQGRFGEGAREDGRNLIEELRQRGYHIVFTRDELKAVPDSVTKLWGIFAHDHTFNDRTEEELAQRNLPLYVETAPTIAEMSAAALRILARNPNGFLLVSEEEGTDNFGNRNNARGALEAGRRADEAIGLFIEFVRNNPNTLMLTTADSDAGGLQVVGPRRGHEQIAEGRNLPERDRNGAPYDGQNGTGTQAWLSAPDRNGNRHAFAVTWAAWDDVSGGILVRGIGAGSEHITGTMDNTDIYRVMYRQLFGQVIN
ncbi:MAG: alkaline phosphatase [Acetobacteraceae bacterium]|nr:alkaline phosphatase [Acetobacteraceae bacterium]